MIDLTIIIPSYNASADLLVSLNSIFSQTYKEFEVLVIDANSTDGTADVLNNYPSDRSRLNYFSEADQGIYDAMNKGILKARGQWIYFMGCGDTFLNNDVLYNVFIQNQKVLNSADFVYGNVIFRDTGLIYAGLFDLYKLFFQNICHQAIFIKKSIVTGLGCFNLKYKILADWDLNIKCFLSKNVRIQYLNLVVGYYSLNGISSKKIDETFMKDKSGLFRSQLQNLNWYKVLRIKSLLTDNEGFGNRFKYLFYTILYRLLYSIRFIVKGT